MWPTEIRLSADRRVLNVAFEDGARFALPAEYLRVSSPSAEVQGHSPLERKVIGGKRSVAILAVEPIGNYAVKLGFDDMHDTGIYGWGYLHTLGREYETRWTTYLGELAERGLDRDTARQASVKSGGGCGSGSCGCH
ncbi:hypothetical protein ADL19_08680 [Streptomyces purpurogeneiscleroticus]|nr:DUF971 domain-containing protein [Methylobacterium fujisawaense]KOX58238.1 hypothetical protein ADL19_08680 [Streptomyces purpurogeneiscleroticus]